MPRTARKDASPQPYHHGDLRKSLVEEAARLVETEGIEALTLREIARRLGVSHAAPGHHFADRAALLSELAADGFEELAVELEAGGRKAKTPALHLRDVGRGYVRFALRRPGHFRVMFGRGAEKASPSARLSECGYRAYQALERAVEAALPRTKSRPPTPERVRDAAFLAWSVVHGAAMLILDGPLAPHLVAAGDEAAARALVDHATTVVSETLAQPAPRAPSSPSPSARTS